MSGCQSIGARLSEPSVDEQVGLQLGVVAAVGVLAESVTPSSASTSSTSARLAVYSRLSRVRIA